MYLLVVSSERFQVHTNVDNKLWSGFEEVLKRRVPRLPSKHADFVCLPVVVDQEEYSSVHALPNPRVHPFENQHICGTQGQLSFL